MRTQEQIIERMKDIEKADFFGFGQEVLIGFLDFQHAKPFLNDTATEEKWNEAGDRNPTEENVKKEMADYMTFAWGKAKDHRGLSAGRSIEKMKAYVWLLENDALLEKIETIDYSQYGAPKLAAICREYSLPIPASEAIARMVEGKPCRDGCDEGCGS